MKPGYSSSAFREPRGEACFKVTKPPPGSDSTRCSSVLQRASSALEAVRRSDGFDGTPGTWPALGNRAAADSAKSGVTYNVHGDEQGRDRPWELDALPFLIPAAEWSALAAGLMQRARLLNMILADVYGSQTLLASGDLPADFVYAHPNFRVSLPSWFVFLAIPIPASLRGASGSLGRRWPLARARRSDSDSVGRGLCRRESDRHFANAAEQVSRLPRAAAGVVFHVGSRNAPRAGGPSSRQSANRADEPRTEQRHLFRRRLSGPVSWLHIG